MPLDDTSDGYKNARVLAVVEHIAAAVNTRNAHARAFKSGSSVVGYEYNVPLGMEDFPESVNVTFLDDTAWAGLGFSQTAGGLGSKSGIVIRFKPHRDHTNRKRTLLSLIKEAFDMRAGWYYLTIVHEITHYLDDHDGRIVSKKPTPPTGSAAYYRLGWEQEARFNELVEDYSNYVNRRLIIFLPWPRFLTQDGTRNDIFDPRSWLRDYFAHPPYYWKKYDDSMKSRVISRLSKLHVPIVVQILRRKVFPYLKSALKDKVYTPQEVHEFLTELRADERYKVHELVSKV